MGGEHDSLDEMARRGRTARESAEHARVEADAMRMDAHGAELNAEARARARISMSAWGLLKNGFVLFVAVAILCVATILSAVNLARRWLPASLDTWGPVALVALILLLTSALWGLSTLMINRGVRSEMAWLSHLPFGVQGYQDVLGVSPRRQESYQQFELHFRDARPGSEFLRDVLSIDGGVWKAEDRGTCLLCTREPGLGVDDNERNRPLVAWFHTFAERHLLEVHAKFPIASLRFIPRD